MKSPKKINGAMRAMAELCINHSDSPVSLRTLVQPGLSVSHLEQLFAQLRSVGLVVSTKGMRGGYHPISGDVSVGDVVRAFSPDGFLSHPAVQAALDGVRVTELLNTVDN